MRIPPTWLVFILLAVVIAHAFTGGAGAMSRDAGEAAEAPLCIVWYVPGRTFATAPTGLQMAVWSDGAVLYTRNPTRPGQELLFGRANEAEIAQLRQDLAAMKGRDTVTHAVPDAGWQLIQTHVDGETCRWIWDEIVRQGWGPNVSPDAEFRRFVCDWMMIRISLAALSPGDSRPASEVLDAQGRFRGFDPKVRPR